MAAVVVRLSHKKFRALIKKHRRKLKRQILAKARDEQELKEKEELQKSPSYWQREAEKQREEQLKLEYEEREKQRMHLLWLVREQQAQDEFQRKKELLEQEKKQENEAELMQKEEELPEEKTIKEKAENNKENKKKKEDALKEAVASLPEGNEAWHNPLAPDKYNPGEKENCTFFTKTGCCRFGDRCSRSHLYPSISCTILIKGMFSHFSIGQMDFLQDEYDADIGLEFDDRETYQDFLEFYDDVLPEFKKIGRVVQFKVSCNHEPHLRGNVYIQYSNEKEAEQAYASFNGRWYAGKQISCEYTNVSKWKGAICGLFHRNQCPKGKNCNFLHVFKNPRNEFWAADNDIIDIHNGNRNHPHRRHFRSSSHYRSRSRSPVRRESSYRRWRRYSPEYVSHHHYKSSSCSHSHRTERHRSHSSSDDDSRQLHAVEKSHSRAKKRQRSSTPSSSEEDYKTSHSEKSFSKAHKRRRSSPVSSDEKRSSYSAKKSHKKKKRKSKKRRQKTSCSSSSD